MSDRSQSLLQIRPQFVSGTITNMTGFDEQFQNQTLRPVLKLQNPLLLAAFKNYIGKHKNRFYELCLEKRMEYVETAIQKDIKFRNSLKGMIVGQFTEEEYALYIKNSSALNKRMMNMVVVRIKDQLQLLEAVALI